MYGFNPMDLINLGLNIDRLQKADKINQEELAMAKEKWELEKQAMAEQIANLPQERSMKRMNEQKKFIDSGGTPDEWNDLMGYDSPIYVLQNPNERMSTDSVRQLNAGNSMYGATAEDRDVKRRGLDIQEEWQKLQKDEFARNADPKSLDNQIKQAQLDKLKGKASGGNSGFSIDDLQKRRNRILQAIKSLEGIPPEERKKRTAAYLEELNAVEALIRGGQPGGSAISSTASVSGSGPASATYPTTPLLRKMFEWWKQGQPEREPFDYSDLFLYGQ